MSTPITDKNKKLGLAGDFDQKSWVDADIVRKLEEQCNVLARHLLKYGKDCQANREALQSWTRFKQEHS